MSVHPRKDRLDYGEQLIPPLGYELERAIGTTYSLDLEALMVLPVALFHAKSLEGNPDEIRFELLDAITKASNKVDVFCQQGHIKAPTRYHRLMAYWEKAVHPVLPESYVQSFHPKVWVIKYSADKRLDRYRVLITSRNLTQARDWDLAVTLEGEAGDSEIGANQPLIDFLRYLNQFTRSSIPESFIRDIGRTVFDKPSGFDRLRFLPIGFTPPHRGDFYGNPITKTKWDRLLIVSPFLDETTLRKLQSNTQKSPFLFSRKEELDGISSDVLNGFDCWQFSESIRMGERQENLEEDGDEPSLQNLHAKLFVGEIENRSIWFLGSANCSEPAQARNIEFMVEMRGESSKGIRIRDLVSNWTLNEKGEEHGLFEPYRMEARESVESERKLDAQLRKIRFDLSRMDCQGIANCVTGGMAYDLEIHIDACVLELPKGFQVSCKPVAENQRNPANIIPGKANRILDFTGYEESLLSPFLEITVTFDGVEHLRFLLAMEIELPDSRLKRIFTSIIDSQDKFLKYLAFLLTGDDGADIIDAASSTDGLDAQGRPMDTLGSGVFERLLLAASRHPAKLKSVETLVAGIEEETKEDRKPILHPEFLKVWSAFQAYRKS